MANPRIPPGMNPRDRRPGDRRSLAPGRPGGAVWYILGLLFLLALAQAWFMAPAGRQISYSEFKQAVRAGQVAEVFVGDQTIRGTYKSETNGGRTFTTTRTASGPPSAISAATRRARVPTARRTSAQSARSSW